MAGHTSRSYVASVLVCWLLLAVQVHTESVDDPTGRQETHSRASNQRRTGKPLAVAFSGSVGSEPCTCGRKFQPSGACLAKCRRLAAESAPDAKHAPRQAGHITFVVWYAVGDKGAMFFPGHQFLKPNMDFADSIMRLYPHARLVLMTDQETQFELRQNMEVFRYTIDKASFGRNAWANKVQFQAQVAFLRHMEEANMHTNVVFMDMDMLMLDSISEVFERQCDYGVTITTFDAEPVNLGIQFVPHGHYAQAIAFMEDVIAAYTLDNIINEEHFTTGQVIVAKVLGMWRNQTLVDYVAAEASLHNEHKVSYDTHGAEPRSLTICYFPCTRYNFFNECMEGSPYYVDATNASALAAADVKLLHFVAYRKGGLHHVYQALQQGKEAALEVLAGLPHTEEGYTDLPPLERRS